jgi:transposase
MIETELYANIRKSKMNGLSMRQTAEILKISRGTVKKYWDGEHLPGEHNYPATVESEVKAEIMEALMQYFEENKDAPKKQRPTAKTAWIELRQQFTVGESTIRKYVYELKDKHPEAFIPLAFDPGECMQIDWCEIKVSIRGHIYSVPVFCAALPFSYTIFAMVLPDMTMPNFIEGHIRAFEYFGGVTERVFYDNLKTAVNSGSGKDAVKQERFKMLEAHYAFEAVFMNARAGNEKGSVENLCGLIRQVAFTPMPKVKSLKKLQEHVLAKCQDYRQFHSVKDRPRPICEMWEEERPHLRPLPVKALDVYAITEAKVGSDLTFRHNTVKYSLPLEYVGKTVTVRVFPYSIEAWHKGVLIYTHQRAFVKGAHQYDPQHYLPLLERRPRAMRNAAPLRYGVMPPQLETFRRNCTDRDKYEQLAAVMLLGRQVDADSLLRAVDCANKSGQSSYSKVCFFLDLYKYKEPTSGENVQDINVQHRELGMYDDLLGGSSDE